MSSKDRPHSRVSQKPNVFEFQDYKPFLVYWIDSRPKAGHGEKSRIANQIQCQLAYISQVLMGTAHFSVEQAQALCSYLEFTEDEEDFFLLLVQRARAGTFRLTKYFDRKIQRALDQRLILKNRLQDKTTLTREDQATYYSHWGYCAIHMAVLIPQMRTPGSLARYLGLSLEKITEILQFLSSVGLVKRKDGEFLPGNVRIHLESDSPMISKHHINWRMQAMRSLEEATPGELHYSSVVGISNADVPKVREVLVQAIEQIRAIVKESKDEHVYSYVLDLFGLGRGQ